MTKVAIIGTAPHYLKAPFDDPSWEIWGTNVLAGYGGGVPRWTRWFELHDNASIMTYPGHLEWLAAQQQKIYMRQVDDRVPCSITYPLNRMVERYGTWFFTSSIAYMMALAIEERAEHIGLYGVDMAADSEYASQKAGCQFFMQIAQMAGIPVDHPIEAEVAVPGRLYCFDEKPLLQVKAEEKIAEYKQRLESCRQMRDNLTLQAAMLRGALGLTLPREAMEEQLSGIMAAQQQAERDMLLIDGALQNMAHLHANWFGDSHG